jgi:hypothetical protein
VQIRANIVMKRNIEALLRARGFQQKALAQWCRRSESWLSKALSDDARVIPMRHYDRIADFLGVAVYQLFQPGINPILERRVGSDRRATPERRAGRQAQPVSHQAALLELFGLLDEQEQAQWIRTLGEQLTGRRPRPSVGNAPVVLGSGTRMRRSTGKTAGTKRTNARDADDGEG